LKRVVVKIGHDNGAVRQTKWDHRAAAYGREKRPAFDRTLKGATRREFDLIQLGAPS
jgi:hypothetical protein